MKPHLALAAALLLAVNCLAQQEPASPWQAAVDDFAQQVISRGGSPSAITVSFSNLSSLTANEQENLKKSLLTAFRNSGIRLVKQELALAEVDITFSEDWQGYVWIANIKQGPGVQTVIKKVSRPARVIASRAPILSIKKTLIWQQETPILDFYTEGQNLLVLDAAELSIYSNDSGKWRQRLTMAITHDHPWPRDLRARLQVSGLQINAFLPGTTCSGTISPPALQCRTSDDPWQIDQGLLSAFFTPARNFFTGVLAGQSAGESVPAFFSAAAAQNGNSRQWVFAGLDGRARVYINGLATAAATMSEWGSNLTALQSSCGTGWQILVTSAGDLTRTDTLQAYEIEGRDVVPVSSPTDLPGPVVALWPGANPQNAHAVVQSLATGRYEAWSATVACGQ